MRESWREVSLEDVVEINPESVRGWDEGKQIRYVEIGCVSPEKGIDLTEVNTFELRDAPTSAKRVIRSDDVLVSNVRPNLRKFALVPPDLDGEVATTGFTVLRAKQEALSRYIWAVIRSTGFTEHLVARVSGAAYPTIKAADVESYTFPLPPTAEQKRIVNLVDSFLESAGSYSNTLEEQAKAIPILRQALLDELLTPPPRDEWRQVTLGDVVEIVSGGTPPTKTPKYWNGDIVWVTPTEVVANNGHYIYDSARKITQEGLANSSAKMLPIGTVLLTSDASIGAVALSGVPIATATGFKSLICGPDILPRFAMYWCQAHTREFLYRSVGSTILHLYKKALATIPMDLPPIEEQQRLVELIAGMNEVAEEVLQANDSAISSAHTLRTGVLTSLLSGEYEIPDSFNTQLESI